MAKRYHSSLINEKESAQCNLPTEVIEKNIGKSESFGREVPQDLYTFVESNSSKQGSELRRITNPKKI